MDLWTKRAVLVRAIDGDTYVLAIDQGFGDYTHKTIRLLGFDTPERSQPERWAAAKLFVEQWFSGFPYVAVTTIRIKFTHDKMTLERYLGGIHGLDRYEQPVPGADLAESLRAAGHAK